MSKEQQVKETNEKPVNNSQVSENNTKTTETENTQQKKRTINIKSFQQKSMEEITKIAQDVNIEGIGSLSKEQLIRTIITTKYKNDIIYSEGCLEIINENGGYGFLRSPSFNYNPSTQDIYVNQAQIRKFGLRTGDKVMGTVKAPRGSAEKFFAMHSVIKINDADPKLKRQIKPFETLTPDFPEKRMIMETTQDNLSMRILDIITPIGFGQRGLIVAPPRSGKTILLQDIANSISYNNPEATLIVLLIDERPEEVTDMKRMVKGEVISSTFDEPHSRHTQVAEMVIEKAKRLTEYKKDVIILLDSITRLARAYNSVQPHSGKILSGGIDSNALYKPKRFFGAARNTKEGGSLTIIATALVDTGSKMDEVIFEEFKGTGNMEIQLDRSIIDKRIFPGINIEKSGTRKEELLLHPEEKERMWKLRRAALGTQPYEAMTLLRNNLNKYKSNIEFLMSIKMN